MNDILGSVRRSLVFRNPGGDERGFGSGLVEKIGSSLRKSRFGLFSKPPLRSLSSFLKDDAPPIRWRKGELIGCGAFGRVYMGMNLNSGELLAVSIAASGASKEKTQAHIRGLEEEVKLLKNLSHPNIVRYLGTAREEDSLNILLEFIPGGSISSLLGKFGSFPESVIRMYTKQLLLGLEYLHKNGIMHRDIKGANILVDNKGCIKLADFGASKKVVELATINGAKSMKGTPYWMAPEVILQTGHSFSADIWSVGCTVIEMATGKPPWSQQYQETFRLRFGVFLREPNLRPVASDLLQHPFVTKEYWESQPVWNSVMESGNQMMELYHCYRMNTMIGRSMCTGLKDVCELGSLRCSTVYPPKSLRMGSWGSQNHDDDTCQIDYKDDLVVDASVKLKSILSSDDINKSFNPMCEPTDDGPCKFDGSIELERSGIDLSPIQTTCKAARNCGVPGKVEDDFTSPCGPIPAEDDEEVTESKIRVFLDEKALDLKKLQTPLYEEFYSTMNATSLPGVVQTAHGENALTILALPPKSRSPNQAPRRRLPSVVDAANNSRPVSHTKILLNVSGVHDRALQEIQQPQHKVGNICSASFSERQRKWKEELDEELERKREMLRQAGAGGKTSSPNDQIRN
ncbi:hypothetical protein I3842_01G161100 [Carya illinoinensis]|uniref:mitogen-activated protein kinase kinase kinase n=1 Tax=Carya illinoinensis TaxID=32201 RepID=A0A922G4H8_CARIL|nr:hypothetical protein I3842_01G161100 [Carya illinoinensis]